ncbi:hypothetical protein BS78_05G191100 [Paspalum vaginatum]|nr:hypothetical protein BS78_05G191100 [Paspalum vaginatum]
MATGPRGAPWPHHMGRLGLGASDQARATDRTVEALPASGCQCHRGMPLHKRLLLAREHETSSSSSKGKQTIPIGASFTRQFHPPRRFTGGEENDRISYAASSINYQNVFKIDVHSAVLELDDITSFFGVYDGHGDEKVALFCAHVFHLELPRMDEMLERSDDWEESLGFYLTRTEALCGSKELLRPGSNNLMQFLRTVFCAPAKEYYYRTICTGSGESSVEEKLEENGDCNIGPQSTEVHEFNSPKGIKVYNMVEWSLDGSVNDVLESFKKAIGHQRLWCFENGKHMDVSELLKQGHQRVIQATGHRRGGQSCLHYTGEGEYWLDGFDNGHACYEFDRPIPVPSIRNPVPLEKPGPFLDNLPGWSLLEGCLGDYSNQNGLCPDGLESVEMGLRSLRSGFKNLKDYRGVLPVPKAVRIACARFVIYGPEAVKLNQMFQLDCDTLEETECESPETEGSLELTDGSKLIGGRTLEDVNTCAAPLMRKWTALSKERLRYVVKLIMSGKDTSDIKDFPATGIHGIEGTLDAINVTPYNLTLPREVCKRRTAKAEPMDEGADGRPHPLSKKFACMWPYDSKIARQTPKSRIITAADIACSVIFFSRVWAVPMPRA